MNQDLHSPSIIQRETSDVEDKPQKSLNEKQQENQELLIRCVAQHLGFAANRPIAACIIYKCLLQWRSFEVERTSVFDRIIQTIGHAIETQDNNDVLAYWLSNASTLLLLLQRTLKASGAAGMTPQRRRSSSATLFGRMTQVNTNFLSKLTEFSQKSFYFSGQFSFTFFGAVIEFPRYSTRSQPLLDQWWHERRSWHLTASWSQVSSSTF